MAKVKVVELLSMLTARGKPRGVKSAQFGHSFTDVGIIEVWNWLAGHASWSDQTNWTGYSPGGGLGMYSDCTVIALSETL